MRGRMAQSDVPAIIAHRKSGMNVNEIAAATGVKPCTVSYHLRKAGLPLRLTVEERFWRKVDTSGDCWLWQAGKNKDGYAVIQVDRKLLNAHRVAYELVVGPIPAGLHLDHLCRVRHCVNPAHLEPVTVKVNTERGMSPGAIARRTNLCPRGHALEGDNLYVYPKTGRRRCRTCARVAMNRYDAKRRGKAA